MSTAIATPQHPARWWHALPDGRIQCDLCPRECTLQDGQRGFCFVRQRAGDQLVLTTYGRSSGFCVDPIEKKPLSHFYPGTSVLSFGTAGCNLGCRFCQNHDISRARDQDTLADAATPEAIAAAAARLGCASVAFTYNDPVIFAEYAMDIADACHERGVHTVAVTAGYMHADPRREFYARMDAVNVDLKAFSEQFYRKVTFAELAPILDTLEYIRHHTNTWLEITTLLIPGQNDSDDELDRLSRWVHDHLGPDVPLHFSAFHPDFKMQDTPATPPATLTRARAIARGNGLHHVYTGNVHDLAGATTTCPQCQAAVIRRDWYRILDYRVTARGTCPDCDTPLPGRWRSEGAGDWGRKRLRVHMGG